MAYAEYTDVETRLKRKFTEAEKTLCIALLDDASVMIDVYNSNANIDVKKLVSCRMVIRAIGNSDVDTPIGASQGTMSALGYSQSWTLSAGATGELYLSKTDKKLLGNSRIGSHSPLEDMK